MMKQLDLRSLILLALLSVSAVSAFSLPTSLLLSPGRCRPSSTYQNMYIGDGKKVDQDEDDNTSEGENIMSSNRLSHIMLRAPSVNATVDFWKGKGATVTSYKKSDRAETCFVTLGNGKPGRNNAEDAANSCFSLEITSLPPEEEFNAGNSLVYLGTSMLLDFQNNLMAAAAGEKRGQDDTEAEPNGIDVRRVASGPGDYFARLCLRPKSSTSMIDSVNGENGENGASPLQATENFYTQVLGMRVVANDSDLLCLRYKNPSETGGFGVCTTLVFTTDGQGDAEELQMGNMLDHIVLNTKNIDDAAEFLKASKAGSDAIFMEPANMFGTKIMGITDPNGYKIYLAEEAS